MGKALLIIIAAVLLVYSFFDLLATPRQRVKVLPKPMWFVVILVPFVGPIAWLVIHLRTPGQSRPPRGSNPPRRGPDDDPDFLRGL